MNDQIEKQAIEEMANILQVGVCLEVEITQCRKMDDCSMCKATRLYHAGYRKQGWISVEDRLPDETKDYLVVLNSEVIDIELFNSKNEPYQTYSSMMNKFLFLDNYGDWHTTDKVTHWMPLPEPPKMKGGAE